MNVLNPLARALAHLAHTGEIPIGVEKSQILDGLAMLIAFHLRHQPDRFNNPQEEEEEEERKAKVRVLSHSDLKMHWEAPQLFDERPGNFYISPDVYANHGVLNIVRINDSIYSRINTFQFSVDCDNHGDMFNPPWSGKKWCYKSKSLASALGGGGITVDDNINNKQNEKRKMSQQQKKRRFIKDLLETKRVGCFLGLVGQILRLSERLDVTQGDLSKAAKANFSKSITKQELMTNASKTLRFITTDQETEFTLWAKSVKSSDILMKNHNYSSHSFRILRVSAATIKNTKNIDANVKSIKEVRKATIKNTKKIDTNVESIKEVRKILNVGLHSLVPIVSELQERVVHLEKEKKRMWIPHQQFNTNWEIWCSKEDLQMKNPFK